MANVAAPDTPSTALQDLQRLYDELPVVQCKGLCGHSCGEHIDASDVERWRIRAAGVNLNAPTADGSCPALTRTFGVGRCSVYDVRPMVCRLWGVSASMVCPHGCVPEGGFLDDADALRRLLQSMQVGGHRLTSPGAAAALEMCVDDPVARSLLAHYLRGRRDVAPALHARMRQLSESGAAADRTRQHRS